MANAPQTTAQQRVKLTYRKVANLIQYARNARHHSPEQIEQIAASITRFGFLNPIVIRDGMVAAGHGRLLAAHHLDMREVPTIDASHLTDQQMRLYLIADNKLAENSSWDDRVLANELRELGELGEDLGITGFDASELEAIVPAELEDPEPLPPTEPAVDPAAYGGATALARASVPMRYWRDKGMLQGRVLDFGAGREQHEYARYDAFHAPDPAPLLEYWDTITCNYVLQVQPAEHLVTQIAALLAHMLNVDGRVLLAVRNDVQQDTETPRVFQIARSAQEWEHLLAPFFDLERADTQKFFGWIGRARQR